MIKIKYLRVREFVAEIGHGNFLSTANLSTTQRRNANQMIDRGNYIEVLDLQNRVYRIYNNNILIAKEADELETKRTSTQKKPVGLAKEEAA